MASIALVTIAGQVLSGSGAIAIAVGTAVAGAVGGLIDNRLLYPALAGNKRQSQRPTQLTGQRIGSLQIQGASEGTGINRVLGAENRVAGTIIWQGPLIVRKRTSSSIHRT